MTQDISESPLEITILMPCLNEAETIGLCIDKANSYLERSNIRGEVVVADNGSTDGSKAIAASKGARVITVADRGYGSALRAGIAAARGRYVIMGDSDDSYDFSRLDAFVDKLREGNDLVLGNRFMGGIEPGAMPFLHRYLGNPMLSMIGRLFFTAHVRDFHCGLRGCVRARILALNLHTTGMEYASEMVIAAALRKYSITEVPTTLKKDGRSRPPHLQTWRDGWRHLRFMLLLSPRWLFIYPSLALILPGVAGAVLLFPGRFQIVDGINIDTHTFVIASIATLVGLQVLCFGIIARRFATTYGLLPESEHYGGVLSALSLERGLLLSAMIGAVGLGGLSWSIYAWVLVDFGPLEYPMVMRVLVLSLTAIAASVQLLFTAFLLGVLEMPVRRPENIA